VVLAVMLMAPYRASRQKCANCREFQLVVSGPTELLGSVARPRYQIEQAGPSGAVLLSGPMKPLPIGSLRQFDAFFRIGLRKALGQPDLDD